MKGAARMPKIPAWSDMPSNSILNAAAADSRSAFPERDLPDGTNVAH
jgi:hypothetical protein